MPRADWNTLNRPAARVTLGGLEAEIWPVMARIRVPSTSHPGTFHVVTAAAGTFTCDCPGYAYRAKCRHTVHVSDLIRIRTEAAA